MEFQQVAKAEEEQEAEMKGEMDYAAVIAT